VLKTTSPVAIRLPSSVGLHVGLGLSWSLGLGKTYQCCTNCHVCLLGYCLNLTLSCIYTSAMAPAIRYECGLGLQAFDSLYVLVGHSSSSQGCRTPLRPWRARERPGGHDVFQAQLHVFPTRGRPCKTRSIFLNEFRVALLAHRRKIKSMSTCSMFKHATAPWPQSHCQGH
jgi:hypothetical protein